VRKRRRLGDAGSAFATTKLSCTQDRKKAMTTVARELVKTTCTDRVVHCMNDRLVVTASCSSAGAAMHFASQVQKFAMVVKQAKG
jgi:hypothetical protein